MKPGERLPIGALSKQSGVNIETIRFYEKIGVMPRPGRSGKGYRIYLPDHLKRLSFVRRSRELGFSLDEVRGLLKLVDGGHYTCAEVKSITFGHLADVRRRISDLRRLERTLAEVAGKCRGGKVPHCPVIEALFEQRLKLLPADSPSAAAARKRTAVPADMRRLRPTSRP